MWFEVRIGVTKMAKMVAAAAPAMVGILAVDRGVTYVYPELCGVI